MKYIITEVHQERLKNYMFKYFYMIFNPENLRYVNFTDYDEDGNEYLEPDHYSFFYSDSYEEEPFEYFGIKYYSEDPSDEPFKQRAPILSISYSYVEQLNDAFGNTWKTPMKLWFEDTFGLKVKTISVE